jgi:hypothetical protein
MTYTAYSDLENAIHRSVDTVPRENVHNIRLSDYALVAEAIVGWEYGAAGSGCVEGATSRRPCRPFCPADGPDGLAN